MSHNEISYIGNVLSVMAFFTRRMMPLRVVALASNCFFLAYGIINWIEPSIVLNLVLIPLNLYRVQEIRNLVRNIENAQADSPTAEWLLPHMTLRHFKKGHVLFHKGDVADQMLFIWKGSIHLPEIDTILRSGALLGEIGIFSPDSRRTQSAVCAEDCDLYTMARADVLRLYYQNPRLGFHLVRIIMARLASDVARKDGSCAYQATGSHPVPACAT